MSSHLFSPETRVHDALRLRPLIAEKLGALKHAFWDRPQATFRDLFQDPASREDFLTGVQKLPVPAPDSHWKELPVSHLVDHLTQNHRDFFQVLGPDVERLFDECQHADPGIRGLREEFQSFWRDVRNETEIEERTFFPRVLRYEACLQDSGVHPEFNGGSLRHALAYRMRPGPILQQLGGLIQRLREDCSGKGHPWTDVLAARLEDFQAQFAEHERLETEVLFPLALEMERQLYNQSIAGGRKRRSVGV